MDRCLRHESLAYDPLQSFSDRAAPERYAPGKETLIDLLPALAGATQSGLDPTMRQRAEGSLNVDLGGVRVFSGGAAEQAASERGARAFAFGQDIVLGSGVTNSLNPVLSHEVAHTVQQRGAAPGPAGLSERGPAGGAHELDADRAAANILHGLRAQVLEQGVARVQHFEGGEHWDVGQAGFEQAGLGREVHLGQIRVPPGAFTALMGDFYGDSVSPDGRTPWQRLKDDCEHDPAKVRRYLDILQRERQNRASGKDTENVGEVVAGDRSTQFLDYASQNFAHFSERTEESDKQFKELVEENPAYAQEIGAASGKYGANIAQYLTQHMAAVKQAFLLGLQHESIDLAVAQDAAACHYLTDAFSAGHMRTPRRSIYDTYKRHFESKNGGKGAIKTWARDKVDRLVERYIPEELDVNEALGFRWPSIKIPLGKVRSTAKRNLYKLADKASKETETFLAENFSNFISLNLHDHDNQNGLMVSNAVSKQASKQGKPGKQGAQGFRAMGDGHMHDPENAQNKEFCTQAVAASAAHIRQVYLSGQRQAGQQQKSGKKRQPSKIPHISLQGILKFVPILDPKDSHNEQPRDWNPQHLDPVLKQEAIEHCAERATKVFAGILVTAKVELEKAVEEGIRDALHRLGPRISGFVADKTGRLTRWVLGKIPEPGAAFQSGLRDALTAVLGS